MSDERGPDAPNPYELSETISTMGRNLQANMTNVMNAETNRVAGIVGNASVDTLERFAALAEVFVGFETRLSALEAEVARLKRGTKGEATAPH